MTPYHRSTGWFRDFRGVIAAAVTPFADDGTLDCERIPPLVDMLVAGGVGGIMVGGTTGEFVTMTPTERTDALAAFVAATKHRVPVIAHVGAPDLHTALALTAAAVDLGADAVAAMTPQFYPATEAAIERYFRDLSAAAATVPLLVYEFPGRAGNTTTPDLVARMLDLDNLAGIKLSIERFDQLEPYLVFEPDLVVICGNDSLQADFVAAGGRAVVSGNATAYPEATHEVFGAFLDGSAGEEERQLLVDLAVLSRAGAPDRLKVLLRARGCDVGAPRCLTHLPDESPAEDATALPARVAAALTKVTSP